MNELLGLRSWRCDSTGFARPTAGSGRCETSFANMARDGHKGAEVRTEDARETLGAEQMRARRELFVGRQAELAQFRAALERGDTPWIVYVHGPGGIGKSTLLAEFQRLSAARSRRCVHLDARTQPAAPETLLQTVSQALSKRPEQSAAPQLLSLDHIEHWSALDGWLRTDLLPILPANTIVVLAGRRRPAPEWRADPGITEFLTELELPPLSDDAAMDYLRRRGVDDGHAASLNAFSRGRPLALALAVDQALRAPDRPIRADAFPEMFDALVAWLLEDLDDPHCRAAVEACSTVRVLDEPTLAAMLRREDVRTEFSWLAGQHFTDPHPEGLVVHDLVREVVIQHLRNRNRAQHQALIRRAMQHLLSGPGNDSVHASFQAMADCVYLMRHEPFAQRQWRFGDIECYPDNARDDEIPGLAAEVGELEGTSSRAWFDHWVDGRYHELLVLRDRHKAPVGLCLFIRIYAADLATEHEDPCVAALSRHLDEHAPLRGGENVLLARFLLVHGTHQARTSTAAEMASHMLARMFTPGTSLLCFVADQAQEWEGPAEDTDSLLLSGTAFSVGCHHYMIGGHDLRRDPPRRYALNMFERILSGSNAEQSGSPKLALIEKEDFPGEVRTVLQNFHDDAVLARSRLLHAPLLRLHNAGGDVEALRGLLEEVSETHLATRASSSSAHQLLELAYFRPAPKQQAIAERLHISERTLRRRLRNAEEQLVEVLWQLDTGGRPGR